MKFSKPPVPHELGDKGSTTKRSIAHEKRIAKETGGRRNPGSGAIATMKGDIESALVSEGDVLLEVKFTDAKSHSVTIDKLKKISVEAAQAKRTPAYLITFNNMPHPFEKDWVLVPKKVLDWKI